MTGEIRLLHRFGFVPVPCATARCVHDNLNAGGLTIKAHCPSCVTSTRQTGRHPALFECVRCGILTSPCISPPRHCIAIWHCLADSWYQQGRRRDERTERIRPIPFSRSHQIVKIYHSSSFTMRCWSAQKYQGIYVQRREHCHQHRLSCGLPVS